MQKHLVAEGNPEGYLAVYPGSCVGSGHVQVSEVLLLTVSPKHSLLLVFFQPEFVCILPCHGAASFKVGITICKIKKKNHFNLSLQLRIIYFTFVGIFALPLK